MFDRFGLSIISDECGDEKGLDWNKSCFILFYSRQDMRSRPENRRMKAFQRGFGSKDR